MISSPHAASPLPISPLVLDITIVDQTPSEAWRIDPALEAMVISNEAQIEVFAECEASTAVDIRAEDLRLEDTEIDLAFYAGESIRTADPRAAIADAERFLHELEARRRLMLGVALAVLGLGAGVAAALLS